MNSTYQALLILLSLFILSSCGSVSSKYHMVKHNNPRHSTLGFSVKPPPGDDWYEKLKDDSLQYLKIGQATNHSYSLFTQAREVKMNKRMKHSLDLKHHVKNEKSGQLPVNGITNLQTSYTIDRAVSKYCVRYSQSYDDHSFKGLRRGRHVDVIVSGLYCLHPDNQRYGVDVSYVEKTLSSAALRSYKAEGEMFLSSLHFHRK